MSKIIFLDIDGPMIPGRAFFNKKPPTEGFLAGFMTEFDPLAVNLLNAVCKERDWKVVIHSSWIHQIGGQVTVDHCIQQGLLLEHFHEDSYCDEDEHRRYTRVAKWLAGHPEVDQYVILDDEPYKADIYNYEHPKDIEKHLMLVDFNDGLLSVHYRKLRDGDWS